MCKRVAAACLFTELVVCTLALAQTTAPATGLDALTDDRLMSELASRGLTPLLERAFEVNRVPQQQRDGMRTLVALRQLSDPKLTASQRRDLVLKIATGIEVALPSLTDPIAMRDQANALLDYGVERDANALEYWGENPRTQASLPP